MLPSLKSRLRDSFKRKRDALTPADHAKLSHAVCEHAVTLVTEIAPPGYVIAAYSPMRGEVDITPVLKRLSVEHSVALPVTVERLGLNFKRYHPGDPLERAVFGIEEPLLDAESVVPDLLLIPLLAFDRQGHRLGWGAGYYDRTIMGLRQAKSITAIGIAFSLQEAETISPETFDQRLDMVITEKETIRF